MAAGLGITALPAPMAEAMPGVVPVFGPPEDGVQLDVWLVARADMRDNDQVHSTFDLLGSACGEAISASLGGSVTPPLAVDATV